MTLLSFTDGLARKLQQKGCRSGGTNNEKQGEKSFGQSLKEQSLWLHGWVQASSRLSGTLAEEH